MLSDYFRVENDFDVDATIQAQLLQSYVEIVHPRTTAGDNYGRRVLPNQSVEHAIVESAWLFGYETEDKRATEESLVPWLLRPSARIATLVDIEASKLPSKTVGVHIRRTDNIPAHGTSDALYGEVIADLMHRGYSVFLATDNQRTEQAMQERFDHALLGYRKESSIAERWPRDDFDDVLLTEDLVELFLLASCEFVVGSIASSFARFAMLYNGSPKCRRLPIAATIT